MKAIKTSTSEAQVSIKTLSTLLVTIIAIALGVVYAWNWGGDQRGKTVQAAELVDAAVDEPTAEATAVNVDSIVAQVLAAMPTPAAVAPAATPTPVYVEVPVPGPVEYITEYIYVPGPERIVTQTEYITEYVEVGPFDDVTLGADVMICAQVDGATAIRLEDDAGREWGIAGGDCQRVPAGAMYNEFRFIVTR